MRAKRNAKDRRIVTILGVPYEMNVKLCREAMVRCRIEGKFTSMEGFAAAVGVSRSVAFRFFAGRMTIESALAHLHVLGLTFDDVFKPVEVVTTQHG